LHIGPKIRVFGLPVPNFLLPRFPSAPRVNYDTVRPMIDNSLETAGVDHLLPTRQSACKYARKWWTSPIGILSRVRLSTSDANT
jgi:hypothetical protein